MKLKTVSAELFARLLTMDSAGKGTPQGASFLLSVFAARSEACIHKRSREPGKEAKNMTSKKSPVRVSQNPNCESLSSMLSLSRRSLLKLVSHSVLAASLAPSLLLAQDSSSESLPRKRRLKLEVAGTLELDPSGQNPTTSPFSVNANFEFVERHVREDSTWWIGRSFAQASARIAVGRGSTQSTLSAPEEVVIETIEQRDDRQVSLSINRPSQPLTLDEMELIKLQAISPAVSTWFTGIRERALTDSWTPEAWSVASALAIDVVTDNQIRCRVKRRQAGKAEVEVRGTIVGTSGDVGTEITLLGTCSVDEASGQILGANWEIQEKRALGPATPGFTARTRLELTDLGSGAWDDAQEQAFQQARAANNVSDATLLVFESKHQGIRLEHSPKWNAIADSSNVAILRLVDQGDLISQAHVTRLQPQTAGTKLTADTYRKDVAAAIGEGRGTIVDVSEFQTPRGYDGLRCTVSAEVSGVAVQWIYMHVADQEGRRVGWIFTTEQDRIDRLGIEDQTLVDSMELLDLPASSDNATRAAAGSGSSTDR